MTPVSARRCSKTACGQRAVATLTYVYADSLVVLGPLATVAEPGSYDLCQQHSQGMSVPKGWEVIRLPEPDVTPEPDHDDLLALAEAVRAVGFADPDAVIEQTPEVVEVRRRGHLRVLRDPEL
ncbi:hypothetical protein CGZ91_01240 [Parenemella sanctibonifatiensis]|uniref:DUF3499 domain-containing protein n=1 Tax=Parenemella sanctibonifatiensis TaxID=2016505 RepID=A0A255EVJ0_9ACTN|nr:hypothetical protein CGZ91_01240 [Parenemella sanctibonifatiensis]